MFQKGIFHTAKGGLLQGKTPPFGKHPEMIKKNGLHIPNSQCTDIRNIHKQRHTLHLCTIKARTEIHQVRAFNMCNYRFIHTQAKAAHRATLREHCRQATPSHSHPVRQQPEQDTQPAGAVCPCNNRCGQYRL